MQELAGRSSHPQGSLPRRCYQQHLLGLPRSARFDCHSERLCHPRRRRLPGRPVAALTSAPRPKTEWFLFSMSRPSPKSFPLFLFPGESAPLTPLTRPRPMFTQKEGETMGKTSKMGVERGNRRAASARPVPPWKENSVELLVRVDRVSRLASLPRGSGAQELIPKGLSPPSTDLGRRLCAAFEPLVERCRGRTSLDP